ncbi:MAG: glycine/betaine ABC transporter permease [Alphaproteobacteria bacterium 16-39-46]|nr:MAG: glycine/betaine ABC transporter permease [Alphaproteobacteria bacterium 16-39-46]OZA44505.1 MAG: glycine/betaine ABC transporter permease [Alphaproteobacteria bacterium 17-39-52]HQS83352.1 glycine/betaine ABC transporter permease [Alphaproteobacteria bacterium]HQS93039.1 glycine/betaine ABC transporter permease [Alphaproteobacteria bacterium]
MIKYALFDDYFFTQKPWWLPLKLYQVVCNRSNPRSKEDLINFLKFSFPKAQLVDINNIPENVKEVILLYPDAIGLGYCSLEKKCFKKFKTIKVLTGRNRSFNLTYTKRASLLLRRFLEISFLSELLFAPFLLLIGSILGIKDKLTGHS